MNEVAGELLFELFEPTVKTRFVNTVLTCVAMEIRLLWRTTLAGQFSKGSLQCRRFHRAHANGFFTYSKGYYFYSPQSSSVIKSKMVALS